MGSSFLYNALIYIEVTILKYFDGSVKGRECSKLHDEFILVDINNQIPLIDNMAKLIISHFGWQE